MEKNNFETDLKKTSKNTQSQKNLILQNLERKIDALLDYAIYHDCTSKFNEGVQYESFNGQLVHIDLDNHVEDIINELDMFKSTISLEGEID